MKKLQSPRGYVRAVLLSILAACLIEAVVNADEVKAAFVAGKGIKSAATSIKKSAISWFKIPQQVSKGAGKVYHILFE